MSDLLHQLSAAGVRDMVPEYPAAAGVTTVTVAVGAAVMRDPDDYHSRMVFADTLDDAGVCQPRAGLIRTQVNAEQLAAAVAARAANGDPVRADDPDRVALRAAWADEIRWLKTGYDPNGVDRTNGYATPLGGIQYMAPGCQVETPGAVVHMAAGHQPRVVVRGGFAEEWWGPWHTLTDTVADLARAFPLRMVGPREAVPMWNGAYPFHGYDTLTGSRGGDRIDGKVGLWTWQRCPFPWDHADQEGRTPLSDFSAGQLPPRAFDKLAGYTKAPGWNRVRVYQTRRDAEADMARAFAWCVRQAAVHELTGREWVAWLYGGHPDEDVALEATAEQKAQANAIDAGTNPVAVGHWQTHRPQDVRHTPPRRVSGGRLPIGPGTAPNQVCPECFGDPAAASGSPDRCPDECPVCHGTSAAPDHCVFEWDGRQWMTFARVGICRTSGPGRCRQPVRHGLYAGERMYSADPHRVRFPGDDDE